MLCVKKFNLIPNPKPFVIRSEIENTPNLSGMGRVGLVVLGRPRPRIRSACAGVWGGLRGYGVSVILSILPDSERLQYLYFSCSDVIYLHT